MKRFVLFCFGSRFKFILWFKCLKFYWFIEVFKTTWQPVVKSMFNYLVVKSFIIYCIQPIVLIFNLRNHFFLCHLITISLYFLYCIYEQWGCNFVTFCRGKNIWTKLRMVIEAIKSLQIFQLFDLNSVVDITKQVKLITKNILVLGFSE